MRHRLGAARPHRFARREMVPQARSWGESLAQAAAALRAIVALRAGATAARTAIVGLVVVVIPQAEEPHQPQDQQAHVENAEAHHEDPPLGTDVAIVAPGACPCKEPSGPGYFFVLGGAVVGLGSGM